MRSRSPISTSRLLLLALAVAEAPAQAQAPEADPLTREVADILAQPGRDLGILPTEVPAYLERLIANPYARENTASCAELRLGIERLNALLGPDFDAPPAKEEAVERRLTRAGVRAGATSVVPFRGLVREATGAAAADRRREKAIDAGLARRGFLRGIAAQKRCRL